MDISFQSITFLKKALKEEKSHLDLLIVKIQIQKKLKYNGLNKIL
jgi:hypothetical protein